MNKGTIIIIAVSVILVAGVFYFLSKRNKAVVTAQVDLNVLSSGKLI